MYNDMSGYIHLHGRTWPWPDLSVDGRDLLDLRYSLLTLDRWTVGPWDRWTVGPWQG